MFNRHSLLAQIRHIQEQKKSGLLRLEKDQKVIRVYFQDGLMEACSSDFPQHLLGQYLVKESFAEGAEVLPLVEEAKRRQVAMGEVAVDRKVVESAELIDVVRRQLFQLLKHAIENDFAVQEFEAGLQSLRYPAGLDVETLLLELARHDPRPLEIDPSRSLILKGGTELVNLPWYPQELSVLNELKTPRTITELAAATGLDHGRINKIVTVLNNLHLIEVVDAPETTDTAVAVRIRSGYDFLVPEIRGNRFSEKLEVVHNEFSFASEQFKTLKVRLSEIPIDRPIKVITVSSAHAADGKSLVCANLALSFAKDPGRRILVIDGDFRNPSLHKYLGTTPEPGLVGYLQNGHIQPQCYLRRLDNLYVLTAGSIPPNPIELLSLPKMRDVLNYFRAEFDTILIDAPPMMPISDARIMMALSDGLVMVVKRGKTGVGSIKRAFRVVDPKKLIGVISNDVKPMLFHTHYPSAYYRYGSTTLYPYSGKRIRSRTKTYLEE